MQYGSERKFHKKEKLTKGMLLNQNQNLLMS
jgi:hypothetical protein